MILKQQNREQQQETGEVEGQQRQRVFLPALFILRIDPSHAKTAALDRTENRRQPGALAFHHFVVKTPEERRRQQDQREEREDQPIVITVHSRS